MIIAPETLAEELRYGRHILNYTQADLAKKAGVGISLISRIEKGHSHTVAFGTLQHVMQLVGREFTLTEGITYGSSDETYPREEGGMSEIDKKLHDEHIRKLFEVKK